MCLTSLSTSSNGGHCIRVIAWKRCAGIPDNSIHYSIFSPPFASLYTYSNSDRDMGNSSDGGEFQQHFGYLIAELYRTIMPGDWYPSTV